MCSNFYARCITTTISSFTLQCTPISRSCNYLGLSILLRTSSYASIVYTRALHWVPMPMPMPTHAHGFWVGMGAMLLFMGGHGRASVLCITASNSKSESNFSDAGNTLTKKGSGLKPMTVNDFLFVQSNQNLV
jgi:hypothetical protein